MQPSAGRALTPGRLTVVTPTRTQKLRLAALQQQQEEAFNRSAQHRSITPPLRRTAVAAAPTTPKNVFGGGRQQMVPALLTPSSWDLSTSRSQPLNHQQLGRGAAGTPSSALQRDPSSFGVTPQSARSTGSAATVGSIAQLEGTIADVLSVRMQSLSELRSRIDQLGDIYRREEEAFRTQMHHIMEQSEAVRVTNETREQSLEAALAKERSDRVKVMQLMSQFKKEGAVVIQVMKESLKEATTKWKAEVERNAKLTAHLRRLGPLAGLGDGGGRSESLSSITNAALAGGGGGGRSSQQQLQQDASSITDRRVQALTQLLEDEEDIIAELRQRNKSLEDRLIAATRERDGLASARDESQRSLEDIQNEYQALLQQTKSCDVAISVATQQLTAMFSGGGGGGASAPVQELQRAYNAKYETTDRVIKLLLKRLAVEQRQRLRVEEQSMRIASAQDQLIQKLEDRVKELEGNRGSAVATPLRGGGGGPSTSGVGNTVQERGLPGNKGPSVTSLNREQTYPSSSRQHADDDEEEDFEPLPATTSSSSVSADVFSQHRHAGLQRSVVDDTIAAVLRHHDMDKRMRSESNALPSLEEQLAIVSKEFHDSVDEWNHFTTTAAVPPPPHSNSRDGSLEVDLGEL